MNKKTISFSIFFLISALILFYFISTDIKNQNNPKLRYDVAEVVVPEFTENTIVIHNQTPDDFMVAQYVHIEQSGFLVLFEEGNIDPVVPLGISRYLKAGTHADVFVTIRRPGKNGEMLYAGLVIDDGSTGFNRRGEDIPVTDDVGELLLESFMLDATLDPGIKAYILK